MSDKPEEIVIPVVSEEVHPGARQVVTGGVRVIKQTVAHEEILEQELRHDRVEVRRVQLNREVDGPQAPRQEGDTLIVPVVEEILRVERSWVLKEEVHVRRVTKSEPHEEKVVVSREEVKVERLDSAGNAMGGTPADDSLPETSKPPAAAATTGGTQFKRRSILGGAARGGTAQETEIETPDEHSILSRRER